MSCLVIAKLIFELFTIHIRGEVSGTVGTALDLVDGPRRSHADMDHDIWSLGGPLAIIVAISILRRLPQLRDKAPHDLVVDANWLRVHLDAHLRNVGGGLP